MNHSTHSLRLFLFTALFTLSLGGWFYHLSHSENAEGWQSKLTGSFLPEGRALPDFQLIDHEGKSFSKKDLEGQWSFVFFGFSHCQKMCPVTMSQLNEVYEKIKSDGKETPHFLMVSIDPERDTPDRMKKFVHSFNKNFVGVTGNEDQIEKLTTALGVVYLQIESKNENEKDYDFDHSGAILLLDPKGNLRALFSMPHLAKDMAEDFELITKYA